MVRKDQRISNDHILPPPRGKNHHLRNIISRQRLNTLINLLRLLPIAPEPNHTELRLDLPRINFNDAHATRNQLLSQAVCKRPYRGLGSAVDAAALVRLAPCNGPDVYNVAAAAVGAGEEDGENGLRHGDEAGDVGLEHYVYVGLVDGGGLVDAFDEAAVCLVNFLPKAPEHYLGVIGLGLGMGGYSRVIHKHIDLLELLRQLANELPDFLDVADVEFDDMDLHALCYAFNLSFDFFQCLLTARRQDELDVGLRARELQRGALPDPRGSACDEDCFAGEALGLRAHSGEVVWEVEVRGQELYSRAGLMTGNELSENLRAADKVSWAKRQHVKDQGKIRGN
jgi:hypothetical protein